MAPPPEMRRIVTSVERAPYITESKSYSSPERKKYQLTTERRPDARY